MISKGNGAPRLCANNLLRIVRGEVPYDRVKGIDSRLLDSPVSSIRNDIVADAGRIIEVYEPRVKFHNVTMSNANATEGDLKITANITEKEG